MTRITALCHELMASTDLLAAAVVKRIQPGLDEITQRQAHDEYGRTWIERATREGNLHPRRKGSAKNSPIMYSRHEILVLIEAERAAIEEINN